MKKVWAILMALSESISQYHAYRKNNRSTYL